TLSFSSPATAPPHTYPLPLHDALPISQHLLHANLSQVAHCPIRIVAFNFLKRRTAGSHRQHLCANRPPATNVQRRVPDHQNFSRSEEHTSELQSPYDLVCRLLLEKKKS